MMIKLLLIFMLLSNALNAQEMSSQEFAKQINQLRSQVSASAVDNFTLHPYSKELITQIAALHMITTPHRDYSVDLEWTTDVIASLNHETLPARRETLLMNMIDTLEGLANEIEYAGAFSGVSRPEMNAALQRAIDKTVRVRVARYGTTDREIAHTTRGGYVMEGQGLEVNLSKAEAVDQSGQPTGSSQGFSSSSSSTSSRFYSQHQSSAWYSNAQSNTQSGGEPRQRNTGQAQRQTGNYEQNQQSSDAQMQRQTPRSQQSPATTVSNQTKHQSSQVSRPKPSRPPAPSKPPPPLPKAKPPKTPTPPAATGLFYYLFIGVMILGVIMTIGIIVYKLLTKVKEAKENEHLSMHKDDLPPDQLTTDTLLDKAMQAAAKENYHEAIRLLTIGALIILEHRRVISYKDSLTNGEYLKKLLVEKELHAKFKEPMSVFDKLIYGFQQPDRKDFFMFRDFYLDLENTQR